MSPYQISIIVSIDNKNKCAELLTDLEIEGFDARLIDSWASDEDLMMCGELIFSGVANDAALAKIEQLAWCAGVMLEDLEEDQEFHAAR